MRHILHYLRQTIPSKLSRQLHRMPNRYQLILSTMHYQTTTIHLFCPLTIVKSLLKYTRSHHSIQIQNHLTQRQKRTQQHQPSHFKQTRHMHCRTCPNRPPHDQHISKLKPNLSIQKLYHFPRIPLNLLR